MGSDLHHSPQPSPPLLQLSFVGVRIYITPQNRPLISCNCLMSGVRIYITPHNPPLLSCNCLCGGSDLHQSPQPSLPLVQLSYVGVRIYITPHNPPFLSCNCLLWAFGFTSLPTTLPSCHVTVLCGGSDLHQSPQPSLPLIQLPFVGVRM